MKIMKILYVITQGEMGGAQLYVATLATAAQASGHEALVAIGENGDGYLERELTAKKIKIIRLKHLKRQISPVHDLLGIFELKKLYEEFQPEIIHLNSTKAGVIGSVAGGLYRDKGKIIYTVHGWVFNEPMSPVKKLLCLTLEKITAKAKDKIICVSDFDRQIGLVEKIAPTEKLLTIHNGIATEQIDFLQRERTDEKLFANSGQRPLEIRLGTIANFYPTKGLNYLIEAIKLLINTYHIPITLIIIGDGELRLKLEEQIKNSQLEQQIILVGRQNHANTLLKSFDIAIMSSVKEGFPYFLLEAMASGLPIVATNVGGIPEIVNDGKTGFLVPPKNPEALAEKIKLLAKNQDLRQQMGQEGLARVKNKFSQNEMIRKTFTLYQN